MKCPDPHCPLFEQEQGAGKFCQVHCMDECGWCAGPLEMGVIIINVGDK